MKPIFDFFGGRKMTAFFLVFFIFLSLVLKFYANEGAMEAIKWLGGFCLTLLGILFAGNVSQKFTPAYRDYQAHQLRSTGETYPKVDPRFTDS